VVELVARLVDITTLRVDAIVNAANEMLAPGGGVCGAIHAKAGPQLAAACAAVGGCPTGEARITPGFRLPARQVFPAAGPFGGGGTAGEPAQLASAYRSSLHLAEEHGLRSIAFPAISTGIFGYPLRPAAKIAVEAVRAATSHPGSLRQVIFACFSSDVLEAYRDEGIVIQP
jgi:O-acetyl-ADP-ribose deacetylase (regulator of RNase III)